MKLSIKNRLVIASVMLLCIIVCGCGGGGGGIKEIRVDPQGIYQSGFTFGGAHYTIIDQAPRGQLFLTPEPSMIIVPEGSDRVMYWQIGSGALFVAKVTATIRADIGFGTISGSGTIYATSMINGSRVTMTFANRLKSAPATINGQYLSSKTILNGSIIIQGHEDRPVDIHANFVSLGGGTARFPTIAGNYKEFGTDNFPSKPLATFTIDNEGRVSGSLPALPAVGKFPVDPGGTFTGTVTMVDATKPFQPMTISFTPNGSGVAQTYSGVVGFYQGTNVNGPYTTAGHFLFGPSGQFSFGWLRQ